MANEERAWGQVNYLFMLDKKQNFLEINRITNCYKSVNGKQRDNGNGFIQIQ